MTKLTALVPMLETEDLISTLAFYRDVLGFQLRSIIPNGESPYWMRLEKDGISLMFSDRNAHSPHSKTVMTGVLYIYTEHIDALWDEIKDQVKILWPIQDFDYGMREFGIADNNGYKLSFGQEI